MQQVKDIVRKALTKKYIKRPAGPLCVYVIEGMECSDGNAYRSLKARRQLQLEKSKRNY